MRRLAACRRGVAWLVLVGLSACSLGQVPVGPALEDEQPTGRWIDVPSLERVPASGDLRRSLTAWWQPSAQSGRRPAVVLLHGCGGMRTRSGDVGPFMLGYAALLQAEGWHVLVPDSLTPRGERELCTQPAAGRRVTQVERRLDALGAMGWLAAQPGVDADRIAVVGWSHGGSAVLAVTNTRFPGASSDDPTPRAAVAFYPGCGADRRRGYQPRAPLLMLLGELDDWTSPVPCQVLARQAAGPAAVQVHTYPGAYHAFDGQVPVRVRADVPNGVNPGHGVHVGAEPAARADAAQRLVGFLRAQFR